MSMRRVDGSSFHLFFVLLPGFLFQLLIFLLLFRGEDGVNPWLKSLVDFFQLALLLIPRRRVFLAESGSTGLQHLLIAGAINPY